MFSFGDGGAGQVVLVLCFCKIVTSLSHLLTLFFSLLYYYIFPRGTDFLWLPFSPSNNSLSLPPSHFQVASRCLVLWISRFRPLFGFWCWILFFLGCFSCISSVYCSPRNLLSSLCLLFRHNTGRQQQWELWNLVFIYFLQVIWIWYFLSSSNAEDLGHMWLYLSSLLLLCLGR